MMNVVVLTGPTASGKTKLGVELAKRIGGEIISADSMQIYKHMDIGTAKPSVSEMEGIPHHMISVVSPFENYSAARYAADAAAAADAVISRGNVPVIVGGTGLYIDALIAGRVFAPDSPAALRRSLERRYDDSGGRQMLRELAEFDPESAGKLHENDKKRIVRAFEIYELTGSSISAHDGESRKIPPKYDAARIALNFRERGALYERINSRTDEMIEHGFLEEARRLLEMGLTPEHTSMQAIGYREMIRAARGEISLQDAAEAVKQQSRRYAKRQLTWLRRCAGIEWIIWENTPDYGYGVEVSTEYLRKRGYNV